MATGSPRQMTPVQMVRIAFIQVGGSLGPGGTRMKFGPVTHMVQTYSCKARIKPPAQAHATTGWNDGRDGASNASVGRSRISLFFRNAICIVSPPSRWSRAHDQTVSPQSQGRTPAWI